MNLNPEVLPTLLKPAMKSDRHGRWPILICSAVLLAAVGGIYVNLVYHYFNYHTPIFAAGGVSLDHLHPDSGVNEDTRIGPTGDHNTGDPNASDVDIASTLLRPERHKFRDRTSIHLKWNVTLEPRAPDGVMKPVYLINGQFPGPTIETRSGDELIIDVYNGVAEEEGISIHWHGLYMKADWATSLREDANEMDGVVGVSQCAIGPSESYTYRFRIDDSQFGTFWHMRRYHAHSGGQRADGLYGGLVVHEPVSRTSQELSVYGQHPEHLLLIGDWYHQPAGAVFGWYQEPGHFGYEPAPDSLLINGKGSYNCSMAVRAHPVECSPSEKPAVTFAESNSVILRVVNTGASAGFSFSLGQAPMTVIAVDGGSTVASNTPSTTSIGLLYAGERVDILVERPTGSATAPGGRKSEMIQQSKAELSLTIGLDLEYVRTFQEPYIARNFHLTNFALTPQQSFPVIWRDKGDELRKDEPRSDNNQPVPKFNLAQLSGSVVADYVAKKPSETSVLYTSMSIRSASGLRPVGSVNRTTWVVADPRAPPLLALDQSEWNRVTKQPGPVWALDVPHYQSGEGKWMELVVNNPDHQGHVFHLHGYDFYVVSQFQQTQLGFPGTYNPFDPASAPLGGSINTVNPLRKDTVYIPRNGYVVLRFPLANDGLWLFHCHTLWHMISGMGIVLQIGEIMEDTKQRTLATCLK
ncbi:multicopper oxidase-domain-containing protein [Penicillium cinerascens]|uniref:Multicopper oxidase-domain-containing protein n=1 Tax=Penicillium cinerascens TaxID=70096 RepID=A0A9W9TDL0_9EURO|nr:multicopper oxidase-domain-containing protein [Penicillium cinerascens]KAJ5218927.1 multicopper oxidase-domain-containing protein [Penicillium cinerascens]